MYSKDRSEKFRQFLHCFLINDKPSRQHRPCPVIEIHLVMGMVRCQVRSLYNCDSLVKKHVYIYNWRLILVFFCILLNLSHFTIYLVGFMIVTGRIHVKFTNRTCQDVAPYSKVSVCHIVRMVNEFP